MRGAVPPSPQMPSSRGAYTNVEEIVPLQVAFLDVFNNISACAIVFKYCLYFSLKGLNCMAI